MAPPRFSAVFGLILRKHRLDRGLSQEALAAEADIHRTHIGLLERGERGAGLDVAERVARALGTRLSALIAEAEYEWMRKGSPRPVVPKPTARRVP